MPRSNCLNLFAYGTLMDRETLAGNLVVPVSEVERRFRLRVAEAPGFRRIYNRPVPEWGGAVLNLEFDKEASVVGVLILDITHQELGMLDASHPHHLPRKPLEVVVEGEKVPALAYMAKGDPAAVVSEAYERRMLDLVERLGEPILSNFRQATVRADGTPAYREPAVPGPASGPPAGGAPAEAGIPAAAGPAGPGE
jgi:hypothetical protein